MLKKQLKKTALNVNKAYKLYIKFLPWMVVFTLILAVILFIAFKNCTKTERDTKDKQLEAVKKTLNWWNDKKDERGFYYEMLNCENDGTNCNNPIKAGTSGHSGVAMIWGRFKYYEKTKDKEELKNLEKDIENYEKDIEKAEIQDDFWNCKMMYEIGNSKLLTKKIKDKTEKLCFTNTYLDSSDFESYPQITPEKVYFGTVTLVKSTAPEIELINPNTDEIKGLIDNKILLYPNIFAFYPSDFAMRYKWKNNNDDLLLAKSTFNRVVALYYLDRSVFTSNGICALGVSALDLYDLNKEQKYLDFANNLYTKENDSLEKEKGFINNPVCGVMTKQLFTQTKDKKYDDVLNKMKSNFLVLYYDGAEKNKKEDIGGFFQTNGFGGFMPVKSTRNNGLIVGLMSSN